MEALSEKRAKCPGHFYLGKGRIIRMGQTDGAKSGLQAQNKELGVDYDQNVRLMDAHLRVQESFDVIGRNIRIGGRRARMYFIDGFVKDDLMQRVMQFLMGIKPEELQSLPTMESFADHFVPYVEVEPVMKVDSVGVQVLSGTIGLLVEGYEGALMVDARTYPARGVEEPDDDRVLRGAHDGFVETLVFNTALIRRRLRDPRLTMEILQVGTVSHTDVVLCYMEGVADPKRVERLRKAIRDITLPSLTMGQESLAECLARRQWYNPFPKVRYTERPDSASASIAEGGIAVVVDNTPSVMLLPTSIFEFVQDANDFYFPPLVGTYLRFVRMVIFLLTLFLTPVWYLLLSNPEWIPPWLEFIRVKEMNAVPILVQLIIIDFMIDGIKLASLNTPGALSNAFGIVGALILGEFAVSAGLFVPEVMLYMAFVAIATFTQPSFELSYAFKLFRIFFLLLSAAWGIWGFIGGLILMLVMVATTKTVAGGSYLFPLIPFHGPALLRLLIRCPIHRKNAGR